MGICLWIEVFLYELDKFKQCVESDILSIVFTYVL